MLLRCHGDVEVLYVEDVKGAIRQIAVTLGSRVKIVNGDTSVSVYSKFVINSIVIHRGGYNRHRRKNKLFCILEIIDLFLLVMFIRLRSSSLTI